MTVNFYGLGELPGASIIAAADIVAGETGDLRQLPILLARGVDVVGLTTGILPGINVDAGPRSWVLSTRPQLRTRRIWDRVEADLDQCEQAWGTRIDAVKIQVAGPWTLSASIELSNGHRALTDTGALRDLTESLIAGIQEYSADVRARFDTEVYVQLDEPLLAQVRDGSLPGTSQFDEIPSINDVDLGERLAGVIERAEARYLNQTGYPPLWKVAQVAGVETCQVTLDTVRGSEQYDGMGHALAAGMRVGLGMTRATLRLMSRACGTNWDLTARCSPMPLMCTPAVVWPTARFSMLRQPSALPERSRTCWTKTLAICDCGVCDFAEEFGSVSTRMLCAKISAPIQRKDSHG